MAAVVVLGVLLDGDIGEVDVHVVDGVHVVGVLVRAEAREAVAVHVDAERAVVGDERVDAQVELLAADQQRLVHVAADDVGLARELRRVRPVCGPLADLRELVDDEDALALRVVRRLHDPHLRRVLAELLDEERVVGREEVGRRQKVEVVPLLWRQPEPAVVRALRLGEEPLDLLAVALDVLDEHVLARELVVVWEVVDQLALVQADARLGVEQLARGVHARPVEVPVGVVRPGARPAAPLEVR